MNRSEIIGSIGLVLIIAGVSRWSVNSALILSGLMLFAYAYLTVNLKTRDGN